ncbi:MAG: hypothetical protein Q7S48_03560 [bacterium]|nr:hypothetical protein [bacterium]
MITKKGRFILEVTDPEQEAVKAVRQTLDFHQKLIYAILGVTAVGFIAVVIAVFDIFIQYKRFEAEKYSEYVNILKLQSNLTTSTQNQSLQMQLDQMKSEIGELWKNKYPVRR